MAKDNIQYVTAPKIEDNRKKYCRFKKNGIKYIDYKNSKLFIEVCKRSG